MASHHSATIAKPARRRILPLELLLIASIPLARAVSLVDFSPKCTGLTSACQSVYQQAIPGCTAADFTAMGGKSCSQSCITGMFSMNDAVWNSCAGDPSNNQNIIGQFIVGNGVQDLCPNAMISTALGIGGGGGTYGTSLVQSTALPSAAPTTTAAAEPTSTVLQQTTNIPSSSSAASAPPTTTSSVAQLTTGATSVFSPPPLLYSSSSSSSSSVSLSSSTPLTTASSAPSTTPMSTSSSTFRLIPSTSTESSTISESQSTLTPASTSSIPFNNPPSALTGTTSLSMLPSPSVITSGIEEAGPQQTNCVPNGGGGSLIGDKECPRTSGTTNRGARMQVRGWAWFMGIIVVGAALML